MATTIFYTGKDGKAAQIKFPSRALAESYAKSLRGSVRYEDSDEAVPAVAVQKCPEGTAEAQKAATNTYYRSVKEPKHGRVVETREVRDVENEAERMAEHFGAARAAGQPMEDAFKDWDYVCGLV